MKKALRPAAGDEGTVIGYLRVSTAEQADSGLGLGAQRVAIEAEAKRRGWAVARWYEDAGASGKSMTRRPALSEALDELLTGQASVLILAKLDRLARSVADYASLVRQAEREGWALVISDLGVDMSTPTGGLLANVTASVAEWEGRVIAADEGSMGDQAGPGCKARPSQGPGFSHRGPHQGRASEGFDLAGDRRWAELRGGSDSDWPTMVPGTREKGRRSTRLIDLPFSQVGS